MLVQISQTAFARRNTCYRVKKYSLCQGTIQRMPCGIPDYDRSKKTRPWIIGCVPNEQINTVLGGIGNLHLKGERLIASPKWGGIYHLKMFGLHRTRPDGQYENKEYNGSQTFGGLED